MTSCQISLAAMHVFWSYFLHCFSFVFLKQEILSKGTIKKFKCGRPSKESSLKVATTRAELHKIQHKSIQVVAEGIGLENYLIRNVAALRNFQCNVCLRKIKTLCRHALFEFLSGRIGSSVAHKRTPVAEREELNFEDLQEGNNSLLK